MPQRPRKYQALADYLAAQDVACRTVTLTFTEIEQIMRTPLPLTAFSRAFWTSNPQTRGSTAREWVSVGWRVAAVEPKRRRVTFGRSSLDNGEGADGQREECVTSDRTETTPAQHVWRQLQLTYALLTTAVAQGLAPAGITPAQLTALRLLDTDPEPPTVSELARRLQYENQAMTGLLDRLERHGWVRRVRDLPDRRAIRVELTAAGRAKLLEALPVEAAAIAAVFGHLVPEDVTALTKLLEQRSPRESP